MPRDGEPAIEPFAIGEQLGARTFVHHRATVEHDGALATTADRSCLDVMRFFGAEEGLVAADAAVRAGLTTRERLAEIWPNGAAGADS